MKKQIIIIVLSIIIFITVVLGIAYAYFAININLSNNTLYNVSFKDDYMLTITLKNSENTTKDIDLAVANEDMTDRTEEAIGSDSWDLRYKFDGMVTSSSTDTITVSVENNTDKNLTCTYDYIWVWDEGSDSYSVTHPGSLEFTVSGPFEEVNVPSSSSESNKLGFDYISVGPNTTSSKDVNVTIKHYNLYARVQDTHKGKNYKGHVGFNNAECHDNNTLTDYIMNLSSSDSSIVNDRGIRYIGKNPNNFIRFNNQMYRIIGVLDGDYVDSNTNTQINTKTLKIVNNTSLGNMYFDKKEGIGTAENTTTSSIWSDSQIAMMLNKTDYLNSFVRLNGATSTYLSSNCSDDSSYICDQNENKIYKNMGAIFNTDTSVKIYAPSLANSEGYTPDVELNIPRISADNANKILPFVWYMRPMQEYNSLSYKFIGNVYQSYNIQNNLYVSSCNNLSNCDYYLVPLLKWTGQIGLISPAEYGFATSGDTTGVGLDRHECLKWSLNVWSNNNVDPLLTTYCANNSWLGYVDANASSEGIKTNLWTIESNPTFGLNGISSVNAAKQYIIQDTGRVISQAAGDYQNAVKDTFYLRPDIKKVSGTGTYNDPYIIN